MEKSRSYEPDTRKPRSRVIPLIRSKSRAGFVIRLAAKVFIILSLITHFLVYLTLTNMIRPAKLPATAVIVLLLSILISALISLLLYMLSEPVEHIRNCSDSIINIETMLAKQMEEAGYRTKEEFEK